MFKDGGIKNKIDMLKISDLKIGNYILHEPTIDDWEEIIISPVTLIQFDTSPDSFAPINLTEEWLLKFGFIRQGNRKMWIKGKVCVVLENYVDLHRKFTGERFYIGFKDLGNVIFHTTFECPFVHTLQNTYSLTGEELKLNYN